MPHTFWTRWMRQNRPPRGLKCSSRTLVFACRAVRCSFHGADGCQHGPTVERCRDGLPFFKHYFSSDSVRGYKSNSLCPLLPESTTSGTGTSNNRVCKDFDEAIDLAELRHSASLSFNWLSPIGPFTMSYAEPLNDKSGDKTESFQITVGSVCQ